MKRLEYVSFTTCLTFCLIYNVLPQSYMSELVQRRRSAETKEERYDLFSSLLDANDLDSDVTLNDSELLGTPANGSTPRPRRHVDCLQLGNIFIFLLAGWSLISYISSDDADIVSPQVMRFVSISTILYCH
jgi:hypothetical protein